MVKLKLDELVNKFPAASCARNSTEKLPALDPPTTVKTFEFELVPWVIVAIDPILFETAL